MSRLSAAALAIVFFTVFFAAPLYAAMTICAMPCCHHDDAPKCCTIATEKVASTAARTVVPQAPVVAIATPSPAPRALPSATRDLLPATSPHISQSLYLLISIFRI